MSKHQQKIENDLRNKWCDWIDHLDKEFTELAINRLIFEHLRFIYQSNSDIKTPFNLFIWMLHHYAVSVQVAIRRITSANNNNVEMPLGNLLKQIIKNPQVVNRDSFVNLYDDRIKRAADTFFDEIVGENISHVDPHEVENDLSKMKEACSAVKTFVDKRIAHLELRAKHLDPIPFDEMHKSIGIVEEIFTKYKFLLMADDSSILPDTWWFDWREVLTKPWIKVPLDQLPPVEKYICPTNSVDEE